MNDRTSKLLLDAYLCCNDMMAFVDGVTLVQYRTNVLIRSGVERQIEIAAEALSKAKDIAPEIVDQIPEYHRLRGMRNRLAHDYERTDNEAVWNTVRDHVPVLRSRLAVLLTDAGWGHALDPDA